MIQGTSERASGGDEMSTREERLVAHNGVDAFRERIRCHRPCNSKILVDESRGEEEDGVTMFGPKRGVRKLLRSMLIREMKRVTVGAEGEVDEGSRKVVHCSVEFNVDCEFQQGGREVVNRRVEGLGKDEFSEVRRELVH